ncbi:MAG: hypothetical protein Tsb0026_16460 [Sulfuricaulis sp.]
MKRKIALTSVFVAPGRVVTRYIVAYHLSRAMSGGRALRKSTETSKAAEISQPRAAIRKNVLSSFVPEASA